MAEAELVCVTETGAADVLMICCLDSGTMGKVEVELLLTSVIAFTEEDKASQTDGLTGVTLTVVTAGVIVLSINTESL